MFVDFSKCAALSTVCLFLVRKCCAYFHPVIFSSQNMLLPTLLFFLVRKCCVVHPVIFSSQNVLCCPPCYFLQSKRAALSTLLISPVKTCCVVCGQKLETQAGRLGHKYRDRARDIELKKQEAEDNWERLEELSDTRSHIAATAFCRASTLILVYLLRRQQSLFLNGIRK